MSFGINLYVIYVYRKRYRVASKREREETAILFGYKIHLHHKAPENTFTKVL